VSKVYINVLSVLLQLAGIIVNIKQVTAFLSRGWLLVFVLLIIYAETTRIIAN